ncbi:MAG: YbhN family protein [Syntrophobacteraceae bacterium]
MNGLIRKKRFWFTAASGLFILVYTIKQADLGKLAQSLHDIDPFWGGLALVASAVSYLCIGVVLYLLLGSMKHRLPFSAASRISLVSTTMNYVMAIGGLSGMAAKVYLLSREKIPPSSTLSISMVHGFLTNTVAIIFVYLGFFYLYSEYKMSRRQIEVGVVILLVAFVLTWLTIQTIIHESFRKRAWQIFFRSASFIAGKLHNPRWFHQERAEAFFEKFNVSMNALVKNSSILWIPAIFALLDWTAMFLCLKWSFLAVNYPVENHTLMVGFSIGIFAAIISITPMSIGVMEGSMAGAFYLMGLDYNRALLATLIYRCAYYFLPILLSLFYYRHFFLVSRRKVEDGDPQKA